MVRVGALFVLMVGVNFSVFALDCPVQFPGESYSDEVVKLVEETTSCWAAAQLVDACAIGASADYYTTLAAREKCMADFNDKLSGSDRRVFNSLHAKCEAKYKGQEGTLYLSGKSFCHLSIDRLYSELFTPVE